MGHTTFIAVLIISCTCLFGQTVSIREVNTTHDITTQDITIQGITTQATQDITTQDITTILHTDGYSALYSTEVNTALTTAKKRSSLLGLPSGKITNLLRKTVDDLSETIMRVVYEEVDMRKSNISSTCLNHISKFAMALRQGKVWALKMMASSGFNPIGLFRGSPVSMGDYKGCQRIDVKDGFVGQYCLVEVVAQLDWIKANMYRLRSEEEKEQRNELIFNKVLEAFSSEFALGFIRIAGVKFGVCTPSTCTPREISSVSSSMIKAVDPSWNASTLYCRSTEYVEKYTTMQLFVLSCFAIIISANVLGTVVDFVFYSKGTNESQKKEAAAPVRVLLFFSAIANTKMLIQAEDKEKSVTSVNGIKSLALFLVIIIHTYTLFLIGLGAKSPLNVTDWLGNFPFMFIANGNSAIEAFLFLSALVLAYSSASSVRSGMPGIIRKMIMRCIRIYHAVFLMLGITILLPHLADGPVYEATTKPIFQQCQGTWWYNLIYGTNYLKMENMCLAWFWYLSADMHLYVLGLLLLELTHTFPRATYKILTTVCVLATATIVVNTVYFDLTAAPFLGLMLPDNRFMHQVDHSYFQTHLHILPYCMGLIVGTYLGRKPKLQISLLLRSIMSAFCVALFIFVIFGAHIWTKGSLPSMPVSVIFNFAPKFAIALFCAWFVTISHTGIAGVVNAFLSWHPFAITSRLSLYAYVLHPMIQLWYYASENVGIDTDHRNIGVLIPSFLVMSYVAAYICFVCYAIPLGLITDMLFSGKKHSTEKPSNDENFVEKTNGIVENHSQKEHENEVQEVKCVKL